MRAGALVDSDGDSRKVARLLNRIVEVHDRLRPDRGAQREDLRSPATALAAVDSRPLAEIVDVGLALLEQGFLEALERIDVRRVALRVLGLKAHLDSGLLEQAFVTRDEN